MESWKTKLDLLNHQLKTANNLKKHLNEISTTAEVKTEAPKEEKLTVEKAIAQRKIAQEKAFISAVAAIPSYKSAEHFHLDLINSRTKHLDPMDSPKEIRGLYGLVHKSTFKMAKRRLSQIVVRLTKDIQNERKKK